jgi:hypothetical protein
LCSLGGAEVVQSAEVVQRRSRGDAEETQRRCRGDAEVQVQRCRVQVQRCKYGGFEVQRYGVQVQEICRGVKIDVQRCRDICRGAEV